MDADVVRHLCLCPVCGKLGDEWVMVRVGPMGCLSHDRCVFEQLGEGILNLPKEEQAKFTLASWAGYDAETGRCSCRRSPRSIRRPQIPRRRSLPEARRAPGELREATVRPLISERSDVSLFALATELSKFARALDKAAFPLCALFIGRGLVAEVVYLTRC